MEKSESQPLIQEKEYLNPGVKAIMACVDIGRDIRGVAENISGQEFDFVNIDTKPEEPLEAGFSGEYKKPHWAYVMSPVDGSNKFSIKYANCTGIIVTGIDRESGEHISFLTHQNPSYFLDDDSNFKKDLHVRLEELNQRSEPGTVDAVLFGGKFSNVKEFADNPDHPIHAIEKDEYVNSINFLQQELEEELGFSPTVIVGPKLDPAWDNVVYDNNERRLFLLRNEGKDTDEFVQNFDAKDVEGVTKELKPGAWGLSSDVIDLIKSKKQEK